MDFAEANGMARVLSVAADSPFLPVDLAGGFPPPSMEPSDARVAVAHSGGWAQPTIALWDAALRHDLRRALAEEGLRKIDRSARAIREPRPNGRLQPYDPFFNATRRTTWRWRRDRRAVSRCMNAPLKSRAALGPKDGANWRKRP